MVSWMDSWSNPGEWCGKAVVVWIGLNTSLGMCVVVWTEPITWSWTFPKWCSPALKKSGLWGGMYLPTRTDSGLPWGWILTEPSVVARTWSGCVCVGKLNGSISEALKTSFFTWMGLGDVMWIWSGKWCGSPVVMWIGPGVWWVPSGVVTWMEPSSEWFGTSVSKKLGAGVTCEFRTRSGVVAWTDVWSGASVVMWIGPGDVTTTGSGVDTWMGTVDETWDGPGVNTRKGPGEWGNSWLPSSVVVTWYSPKWVLSVWLPFRKLSSGRTVVKWGVWLVVKMGGRGVESVGVWWVVSTGAWSKATLISGAMMGPWNEIDAIHWNSF